MKNTTLPYIALMLVLMLMASAPLKAQLQQQAPGSRGGSDLVANRRIMPAQRNFAWYQGFYANRFRLSAPGVHLPGPPAAGHPAASFGSYNQARQWLQKRYNSLYTPSTRVNPKAGTLMPAQRPYNWYQNQVRDKLARAAMLRLQGNGSRPSVPGH